MKCPYCQHDVAEARQFLYRITDKNGKAIPRPDSGLPDVEKRDLSLAWMVCPNSDCHETIVQVNRSRPNWHGGIPLPAKPEHIEEWFAVPREGMARSVDKLVPPDFKRDYSEASLILAYSPRMSAVLSRRILAELLRQYAGRDEYGLADQIDKFLNETKHPSGLRKNLHVLREMGDFGAHTKRNQQDEIVDVDGEEAEWTLDVIDSLFDYFIVGPGRDAERRDAFEQKMEQAGRRPIKPLPEDKNGE